MQDEILDKRSLIQIKHNGLIMSKNILEITNRIIFNGIDTLFNEAFYLINSKHLKRKEENFCFLIEFNQQLFEKRVLNMKRNQIWTIKKQSNYLVKL